MRQSLGRLYFICKRHLAWRFSGTSYARDILRDRLPCVVFTHQSVILRPLRHVDMYLQENKRTNLALAVGRLSGVALRPGETLSFWRLVGRPSRAAGYKDGLVLHQGALRKGVGGGLCQLSNLIYWMTLHTPLRVIERWRHGYDVFPDSDRTQPFGSGATVAYNYVDLQIENPTNQTFQLDLWLDAELLHGAWRCEADPGERYQVTERHHRIEALPWGGYLRHNELYRLVRRDGGEEREEFLVENNALMLYEPMIEAGV